MSPCDAKQPPIGVSMRSQMVNFSLAMSGAMTLYYAVKILENAWNRWLCRK